MSMFHREHVYTVHENPALRDPEDRMELVVEGFSWGALILGPLWMLLQRMWIPAALYFLTLLAMTRLAEMFATPQSALGILQFGLQFIVACHTYDFKRWVLDRRGYRLRGVIVASSSMLAQQRALAAA